MTIAIDTRHIDLESRDLESGDLDSREPESRGTGPGVDTLAVRGGEPARNGYPAVATPIVCTATYAFADSPTISRGGSSARSMAATATRRCARPNRSSRRSKAATTRCCSRAG
jgi:hypothetical protein